MRFLFENASVIFVKALDNLFFCDILFLMNVILKAPEESI